MLAEFKERWEVRYVRQEIFDQEIQ